MHLSKWISVGVRLEAACMNLGPGGLVMMGLHDTSVIELAFRERLPHD